MSAAPRPQTDDIGSPPGDAEGWALLDALRRRLDDQASLTRKTQGQVQQLADSIAALVEVQRKRARWLNLNSFVAYLVFTLLCGGASYFLYESRARELVASRDRVIAERDSAVRRADEATAAASARDAADAKAWETYQLLEGGKRDAAAKKLSELQAAPLSKLDRELLAHRAKQAEGLQVEAAIKGAMASFKSGRHAEAVAPLAQALALDPTGPRAPEVHYLLGVAHAKANALDQAIVHLQAAVSGNVAEDDARYQLASVLDRAGQWGKARAEYDRFATAHPQLGLAVFAMRRSAALARLPAVAPVMPAAPEKPAAPPAPPQPAEGAAAPAE